MQDHEGARKGHWKGGDDPGPRGTQSRTDSQDDSDEKRHGRGPDEEVERSWSGDDGASYQRGSHRHPGRDDTHPIDEYVEQKRRQRRPRHGGDGAGRHEPCQCRGAKDRHETTASRPQSVDGEEQARRRVRREAVEGYPATKSVSCSIAMNT